MTIVNVIITCAYCNNPFSGKIGRKYCSQDCYLTGQKRPLMDRFWEKVQKTHTCWLWTGTTVPGGYGMLGEGKKGQHSVHRLSYQSHRGPIPEGMRVCHTCDVPHCVNPAHLFLGTAKDNSQDMVKKGRSSRGVKNGTAKLVEDQVKEIRQRYAEGSVTQRQLAKEFSMGQCAISNIVNHRRWTHVD